MDRRIAVIGAPSSIGIRPYDDVAGPVISIRRQVCLENWG